MAFLGDCVDPKGDFCSASDGATRALRPLPLLLGCLSSAALRILSLSLRTSSVRNLLQVPEYAYQMQAGVDDKAVSMKTKAWD